MSAGAMMLAAGSVDRAGRCGHMGKLPMAQKAKSRPSGSRTSSRSTPINGLRSPVRMHYNAQVEAGLQWCRDNLPYINFVEHVKYPMIVNKNLKNVPVGGYAIAGNFSVVQMYFETP